MRPEEKKVLVTFETTTTAMAFEEEAKKAGLKGRLIPVPKQITAGCGLSYCAPVCERSGVQKLADKMEHQNICELMI